MMMMIATTLLAAVLYGAGAAVEQRQAAAAPESSAGRPRLLLLLVRQPLWLLGLALQFGGFAAHAAALRSGPLATVQMLVALELVVAVVVVRCWSGRPLSRGSWPAAVTVVAGIAIFLLVTSSGHHHATHPNYVGAAGLGAQRAHLAGCVGAFERGQIDHADRGVDGPGLGGGLDAAGGQRRGTCLGADLVDPRQAVQEPAQRGVVAGYVAQR